MTEPDELSRRLYEAVFGGPMLSEAEFREVVEREKIPVPSLVRAVPEGGEAEGRSAGAVLHLPPAGSFRFLPVKGEAGLPWMLERPSGLAHAIQQAILRERRRDLAALKGTPGDGFTRRQEAEAFALALGEARRGGRHGERGGALEVWTSLVLHRHHAQVNAVRLRWVEFLTALTRGSDANLAFVSYSLIRAIYREHAFSALARLPGRIVAEVLPLLAGRPGAGEGHPVLPKAFAFMEKNFATRVGLAEVAAACHISPAHLARVFRRATGQTVVGYLQRLRIGRACEQLATTGKPLLEVAFDAGFESIEHFHRLFRRECGVTPRAYRLAHR